MHRMVYFYQLRFDEGLGVDLTQMSNAMTLRSLSGIFSPLLSSVADSRGRKTGLLLGLVLYTIGAAQVIFIPVFPAFVVALVLTSTGYLIFIPSMQAYLGDRVAYERRSRAMAVTEMGWSLSLIIGVPLVAFLIARWGWLAPFPLLALLGGISLLIFSRILPKDTPPKDNTSGLRINIGRVLTSPAAIAGLLMGASFSAANEMINLVLNPGLENDFGLQLAALGGLSIAIGFMELSGEAMVGIFTDRIGKVRAVAVGLILNCLALLMLPTLGNRLIGAGLALFFFYMTFEFTIVSALPLMSEVLPAARATLMGTNIAMISIGRAAGAALASRLYLLEILPPESPTLLLNTLAALVFNLVALVFLVQLRRKLGKS